MRVSVLQFSPTTSAPDNLAQVRLLIDEAVRVDRADMVVLPEMWSCLGGDRHAKFDAAEALPQTGDPGAPQTLYGALQSIARNAKIVLHGGSIGERVGERLCNTTVVFDTDGSEIARYRKIHLFDITTPSGDGYKESATYDAGDVAVVFAAGGMKVGCAICYDIRFPALFARLRDDGAELIVLPAAFTAETGAAHWETLIRARAIETQCWFAASATTGRHSHEDGTTRTTFGHSMIVDPWGTIVAQASRGVGRATAQIDRSLTERVRRDMPVWQHRKWR